MRNGKNEGNLRRSLLGYYSEWFYYLQIVESSQDLNDDNQVKLMGSATHFNPVDLVCGIKITKTKSLT
jgi:hypothetical protein